MRNPFVAIEPPKQLIDSYLDSDGVAAPGGVGNEIRLPLERVDSPLQAFVERQEERSLPAGFVLGQLVCDSGKHEQRPLHIGFEGFEVRERNADLLRRRKRDYQLFVFY